MSDVITLSPQCASSLSTITEFRLQCHTRGLHYPPFTQISTQPDTGPTFVLDEGLRISLVDDDGIYTCGINDHERTFVFEPNQKYLLLDAFDSPVSVITVDYQGNVELDQLTEQSVTKSLDITRNLIAAKHAIFQAMHALEMRSDDPRREAYRQAYLKTNDITPTQYLISCEVTDQDMQAWNEGASQGDFFSGLVAKCPQEPLDAQGLYHFERLAGAMRMFTGLGNAGTFEFSASWLQVRGSYVGFQLSGPVRNTGEVTVKDIATGDIAQRITSGVASINKSLTASLARAGIHPVMGVAAGR